jgi:hypothetical protein
LSEECFLDFLDDISPYLCGGLNILLKNSPIMFLLYFPQKEVGEELLDSVDNGLLCDGGWPVLDKGWD